MKNVQSVLHAKKAANENALIGYFPAGYPNLAESIEAAVAMCDAGVDVLELGIPYSDPVMDGPVIQKATEEALANGFKFRQIFDAVAQITARVDTPVLVMTYWNPVLQYGVEKFAAELKKSGGAGLITPDLIPDEAQDWLSASNTHDLERVFLVSPTSTPERVKNAAILSKGFAYAVSTMGITGSREQVDSHAQAVVASIRAEAPEQIAAVGIGISTAEQAAEVTEYADAAIVGSLFIRAYHDHGLDGLRNKVSEIVAGLRC